MTKKYLVLATETITYREEIDADNEAQAKDLFKLFYKAGTVFQNNSDEFKIYSAQEIKDQ
jgi:hypothetical protein